MAFAAPVSIATRCIRVSMTLGMRLIGRLSSAWSSCRAARCSSFAISTAGASPALAKRMKREISELFGVEYTRLAIMLNDARGWAKGTLLTYQDRKSFFESIVNGEPDPIELLRAGDERAVLDLIAAAQRTHASA